MDGCAFPLPLVLFVSAFGCSAKGAPSPNSDVLLFGNGGGCSAPADAASPEGAASPCTPSIPTVSFAQDVAPIVAGCTGEICHEWSYSTLVGTPALECCDGRSIVSPGHPEQSYLLQKLLGSSDMCGGAQMPLGGTPIDPHSVALISSWICLGAPND